MEAVRTIVVSRLLMAVGVMSFVWATTIVAMTTRTSAGVIPSVRARSVAQMVAEGPAGSARQALGVRLLANA